MFQILPCEIQKLFVSASSLRRTAAKRREEIKECLTTVKQVVVLL